MLTSIRIKLDPSKPQLSSEEKAALQANVQLLRDAIVLFTATGAARGVSGHTGQYSFRPLNAVGECGCGCMRR